MPTSSAQPVRVQHHPFLGAGLASYPPHLGMSALPQHILAAPPCGRALRSVKLGGAVSACLTCQSKISRADQLDRKCEHSYADK
jgi:hypothetical protein